MWKLIFPLFLLFPTWGFQTLNPEYIGLVNQFDQLTNYKNQNCGTNVQRISEIEEIINNAFSPYDDCTREICGEDHVSDVSIMEEREDITPEEQASFESLLGDDFNGFFSDLQRRARESHAQASPEVRELLTNQRRIGDIFINFASLLLDLGIQIDEIDEPANRQTLELYYTPAQLEHLSLIMMGGKGASPYSVPDPNRPLPTLEEINQWLENYNGYSIGVSMLREIVLNHNYSTSINNSNSAEYWDSLTDLRIFASMTMQNNPQEELYTILATTNQFLSVFDQAPVEVDSYFDGEQFSHRIEACKQSILSKLGVLNSEEEYQQIRNNFVNTKQAIVQQITRSGIFSPESARNLSLFIDDLAVITSPSREEYARILTKSFGERRFQMETESAEEILSRYGSWASGGVDCNIRTGLPNNSYFLPQRDLRSSVIFLGDIHAGHLHEHGGYVLAHEMGHAVSEYIDRQRGNISNETQDAVRSTKICLARGHIENRRHGIGGLFQGGPNNFVEEDFADLFAAHTYPLPNNPACAFLRNGVVAEGDATLHPRPSELENSDHLHSNQVFRILHMHQLQNGSIPNTCLQAMASIGEEFNIKPNCWRQPAMSHD